MIDTYFRYGEPRFQEFDTVEKISRMFSIEDIKNNDYLEVFGGITPQGAALAMARIHKHLGDLPRAKEFAMIGLKILGRKVALKPAFENILSTE